MANKKVKEVLNLSVDELVSKARETERQVFDGRMKLATGQLENVSSIWKLRKELARIKTVLSKKKAEASAAAKAQ